MGRPPEDVRVAVLMIQSDDLDGGYIAEWPHRPGCVSQGKSISEAARNAADALDAVEEVLAAGGETETPAADMPVEHETVREYRIDGARCRLCGGGAYPPWLTDDETWQSVMGDSHEQVCLPCFFGRAETRGEPLRVSLNQAR